MASDRNTKIKIPVETNPSSNPKHRIKNLLFFSIIVLLFIFISGSLLFAAQKKIYFNKKAESRQDFSIDQNLVRALLNGRDSEEKQIRVVNTGDSQISIGIQPVGFGDIVKIDSPLFTLQPSQTKIVTLKMSSFDEESKTEQQPGVYAGKLIVKSEKSSREIPAVVEIGSGSRFFGINLNSLALESAVKQGSEAKIEVRLFNLESEKPAYVDVYYFIKDLNGKTVTEEKETVIVKTQASFLKTISVPKNLNPGMYIFAAETRFNNSVGEASYLFEVTSLEDNAGFVESCKTNSLCLGLSSITLLLLLAVMAYSYFLAAAYFRGKKPDLKNQDSLQAEEELEMINELGWEKEKQKMVKRVQEEKKEEVKKPNWFGKFFAKTKEEKPQEQKGPKSETEELEEAIRSLSLFKEFEKKSESKKEFHITAKKPGILQKIFKMEKASEEPEKVGKIERSTAKSRNFEKFRNAFDGTKNAIRNNDLAMAKKLYMDSRDMYITLSDEEKKDIYGEMLQLYNKLLR